MSRFAASFWPCWPPAPISVCASSMNMTIGVGEAFTASITPFRRFSNSPFTPAPACSRPRSSDISFTVFSASGTSPAAMRSARPSATAVLPTPGSPVRIGLFCRRRVRMSMTWRISPSRPRIGSIFPALACAVRSVQNWSSGPEPRGAPCPAGAPPSGALPAGAAAEASDASSLPAASASKPPRRRSSPRMAASAGTLSFTVRCSVSSVSSAASRWPDRSGAPLPSSEASTQASRSQLTMSGESEGARALPVRSRSRARVSSAATRPASTPVFDRMTATSEPWVSTRRNSRCSISTL